LYRIQRVPREFDTEVQGPVKERERESLRGCRSAVYLKKVDTFINGADITNTPEERRQKILDVDTPVQNMLTTARHHRGCTWREISN